jgi:hypothetical protein
MCVFVDFTVFFQEIEKNLKINEKRGKNSCKWQTNRLKAKIDFTDCHTWLVF